MTLDARWSVIQKTSDWRRNPGMRFPATLCMHRVIPGGQQPKVIRNQRVDYARRGPCQGVSAQGFNSPRLHYSPRRIHTDSRAAFLFLRTNQLQWFLQEIKLVMTSNNSNVRIQTLRVDPCVERVDQRVVDWSVGLS